MLIKYIYRPKISPTDLIMRQLAAFNIFHLITNTQFFTKISEFIVMHDFVQSTTRFFFSRPSKNGFKSVSLITFLTLNIIAGENYDFVFFFCCKTKSHIKSKLLFVILFLFLFIHWLLLASVRCHHPVSFGSSGLIRIFR